MRLACTTGENILSKDTQATQCSTGILPVESLLGKDAQATSGEFHLNPKSPPYHPERSEGSVLEVA